MSENSEKKEEECRKTIDNNKKDLLKALNKKDYNCQKAIKLIESDKMRHVKSNKARQEAVKHHLNKSIRKSY